MSDRINDMLLDQIADLLDSEPPQDAGQHPSLDVHERVGHEWAEWRKQVDGLRITLGSRLTRQAIDQRLSKGSGCGSCFTCDSPTSLLVARMYVCATCGNKRCPAASNCRKWECSGSNDPNQIPVAKEPTHD